MLDYNRRNGGKTVTSKAVGRFFSPVVQPLCALATDGCPVGPGPRVNISILNHSPAGVPLLALARPPRAGGRRQIDGKCAVPKHGVEIIPLARVVVWGIYIFPYEREVCGGVDVV